MGQKGWDSRNRKWAIKAPASSGSQRIQGHPEYAVKTMLHGIYR